MEVTQVPPFREEEVTTADIREHWHWVRQGIEEILEEHKHLTFIPEDVYAECKAGRALLWVGPEVWAVTTVERDQFTGAQTCLIWLMWSSSKSTPAIFKYLRVMENIAAKSGFQGIEARTPLKGLGKSLERAGWSLDHIVYRKEL